MKIEQNCQAHRSRGHQRAYNPLDSTYAIERRAGITVARNMLVAVSAHSIAHHADMLSFALCMVLVTDIASTSAARVIIDIVGRAREGPLVGIHLDATDIADLSQGQVHLFFCARRVLLLGKVVLAETFVTIWATSQGFLITFMTAAGRFHHFAMCSELFSVIHKKDPLSMWSSLMHPVIYTLKELSMDHYSK
jgi:hypothetical protein